MPWPLKSPWYLLDRKQGGPQSQSGGSGEEKNSQPLLGLRPHDLPAPNPMLYH